MDAPSSALAHPAPSAAPQPASASPTGPQIRSRITVVCAECKRLKLKCDRRVPCGSCTKRDTVQRCQYSPAAAEKVDLHSLHNRLIQVESFISMMSSGQQPPPFQSSYPLPAAPTSGPSSSSTPAPSSSVNFASPQQAHQHHHHYAAPPAHPSANSIALSEQDLATVWLDGLDLGVSWLSSPSSPPDLQPHHAYPNGASAGYIKLEPSAIDVALSLEQSGSPAVIDVDSSTHALRQPSRPASPFNSRRHRRAQQSTSVQQRLPAFSIYYPVPSISLPGSSPSSSAAFPHHPSANVLHLPQQPQPQYSKPQVTPALLALLPPIQRCRRLLHLAHEVFLVRPVPFEPSPSNGGAWKAFESRCMALLSNGYSEEKEREREKKEKAREARRARQIYFGGIAGLRNEDSEMDDASGGAKSKEAEEQGAAAHGQSLTFFATMCAVLAVGAFFSPRHDSGTSAGESPAFFYALSQQALGVWDTHISSTSASASTSSAADEAERMDHLLACLIGVEFLMLSEPGHDREEDSKSSSPIYSLVGKLVSAQRNLGLGKDTASLKKGKNASTGSMTATMSKRAEKERMKEEWRRMVLWQVMYCDFFTTDALGHQPYFASYSYSSTKLPACSYPSSSSSELPGSAAEQEAGEEYQHSPDDMQYDGYDSSYTPNSTRQRRRQQTHPQSTLPLPHGSEEQVHTYLGARYRLTQLAQAVKDRIEHPDCCCGYTLDQAAALEDEIRRWHAGLPASLRVGGLTVDAASSSTLGDASHPKGPFHDLLPSDGVGSGSAAVFGADKAALMQSCELAVMLNLLILKIYAPFMRHAASSASSSSSPPSNSGGVHSSACQTSIQAAQAILRGGKMISSLFSSRIGIDDQEVLLPSLFDYYPLDRVIFDAVVICAHAGLTGKAATFTFDVGALLEDVYAGLGFLSDMLAGNGMGAGLGERQERVVEVLYKRVQHRGGNAGLLKRKHDEVDVASAFGGSSTYSSAREAAAGDSEAMAAGFDFTNTGSNTQYQSNGVPSAQQQHANVMAPAFYPPSSASNVQNTSIPAGSFPQDHLQRSERERNGQDSALTSANTVHLPASSAAKEKTKAHDQQDQHREKEKGQKHSKKSHAYPSVGIRVRPGKGSPLTSSRSRQQSVSVSASAAGGAADGAQRSSVMSSTAVQQQQQSPLAESVLAFQRQQKQKSQQVTGESEADAQRSRSSSVSYLQTQTQAEQQPNNYSSLPFGPVPSSSSNVMDSVQGKPFNFSDGAIRQIQQQRQHLAPDQSPFTSRPFEQLRSIFDGSQQQSYDPSTATSHTDGVGYGNTVSSPFSPSAGPPSSTGSPFTSASSGHPPTPTFNAHHPTPPVFGPQPTSTPLNSSPTTYFLPPTLGASYTRSPPSELSGHHRNTSLIDMGIDQTMLSSTSVYDKSQQQRQVGMYDVKPPLDVQGQQHQQLHMLQQPQLHMQSQAMGPPNSYEDQDMSGQHPMTMPPHSSWSTPNQQQQAPLTHNAQNYWDMGTGFRFPS